MKLPPRSRKFDRKADIALEFQKLLNKIKEILSRSHYSQLSRLHT